MQTVVGERAERLNCDIVSGKDKKRAKLDLVDEYGHQTGKSPWSYYETSIGFPSAEGEGAACKT